MKQRSTPGGKTAKATHGNTNTRRRGHEWSAGAWKHAPKKREGISTGVKVRVIVLAALIGLAIALPSPF